MSQKIMKEFGFSGKSTHLKARVESNTVLSTEIDRPC